MPGDAASGNGRQRLAWVIAGVAVAGLIAVVAVPTLLNRDAERLPPPPTTTASAPGDPVAVPGDPRAVDLSSMTPREAADRLFNRVMQNVSSGDTAQARAFVPMAVSAYERVEGLDADGRYHLAVLHLVGGDARAALSRSEEILAETPTHLLGLFTAAQAEAALGNQSRARELYQRFVDAYATEAGQPRPEYQDHGQALPSMLDEARRGASGSAP